MGTYEFKLPDLAEGTTEGEIATWYVTVGARIEEEQPLVGVMTDKAIIDIPSPVTGTVASLHGAVGDKKPVGSVLVVIQLDEVAPDIAGTAHANIGATGATSPNTAQSSISGDAPLPRTLSDEGLATIERPTASPSVRRRAREAGMSLADVHGSGPGGRIQHADIDAALSRATVSKPAAPISSVRAISPVEDIRIIGMRRKIAERMALSKRTIPHFTYVEEIDVTELEALRLHLNSERSEQHVKLTPLAFLMRALARVLPAYPDINATYDSEAQILRRRSGIHTGIATQTPAGLMVPVVRHIELRDLWDCAQEFTRVTTAAKAGSATRDELSGSTITLTSLGLLGGIAATPIINAPEVAIIGPNRIIERPVVRAGQIVIRKMMNLSASFDHRLIDGYVAADFIQHVKRVLEMPAMLFIGALPS